MKKIFTLFTVFFGLQMMVAQTLNHQQKDSKGKEMLLGTIDKDGLMKAPFAEWFNKNHDDYAVNDRIVRQLKDSLSQYTIKLFLGTWCGDSKREVPHFYSILENADFPINQLEVIGVDHEGYDYKKGPNGEEKNMLIHRVPTFIFYKDGKEVNRIVEFPQETLERDILKIVHKNNYYSKYYVANIIFSTLENNSIEALQKNEINYLTSLPEYSEGSKELNTLGYVYKHDKQYEKALYIFDLNTKMFPYNPNGYDSLGETYFNMKKYPEALKNYNKVLELKPEDENALKIIAEIKASSK
ncbi:tetratricopeptide repeat protein [Bizionia argentinensis JUB59]|uniref:Tetratricopeptide repeat protein n=1 Tax=Bizionia argentinensis JUB59 TaxID=1046627 RepID=G2EH94_9FLAO|nr:tetratricopeptide repeat protein [Bizionia argentinensis]EGV42136.1 tetratricopeptide repeat protein [Bizionia argentinensis JUB59]